MKHSTAVDFVKTGIPSTLESEYIPASYPDYFEKTRRKTHKSNKILGELYRAIAVEQDQKMSEYGKLKLDSDLEADEKEMSSPEYEKAIQICKGYNNNLIDIMNQYDLKSEAEAITGNFIKVPRYHGKDEFQIRDSLMKEVKRLQETFRKSFFRRICG
eukprot:TRINITY_DN7027_c0_g1_i1.p1 TRINITY_DN7027_c0_g1~~TRINITY_DN7027_c0_g1_i1.p1  ORF type:complete len:158 (+),score=32.50 TRINITY_DN7027_c0_g1_i1:53-526(+)